MELSYSQGIPDLTGKRAVIVGGGRGIGRATALCLAAAGALVAVIARTPEEGTATVAEIHAQGGRASFHAADVRVESQIASAIDAAAVDLGGLDIAVNCAGQLAAGELHQLERTAWDDTIAVNLTGTWLALKHELRHMRLRRGGAIVNVASNLGAHAARPGTGAYAATKAGVAALSRVAALEAIADGIRVNTVSPGPIRTPMSRRPGETDADRDARVAATLPLGRIGEPDEVAQAIRWLVSPAASLVVGHDLILDGGLAAT